MQHKILGTFLLVVAFVAAVAGDTKIAALWCALGGIQLQLVGKQDR